jgi:hypothetical protein
MRNGHPDKLIGMQDVNPCAAPQHDCSQRLGDSD